MASGNLSNYFVLRTQSLRVVTTFVFGVIPILTVLPPPPPPHSVSDQPKSSLGLPDCLPASHSRHRDSGAAEPRGGTKRLYCGSVVIRPLILSDPCQPGGPLLSPHSNATVRQSGRLLDWLLGRSVGRLVGVAGLKEQKGKKAHPADALLLHHHHSSSSDDGMDLIRWVEVGAGDSTPLQPSPLVLQTVRR